MLHPYYLILKTLRRLHRNLHPSAESGRSLVSVKGYANDLIAQMIESPRPVMIARLGSTELLCLSNYLGVRNKEKYAKIIPFLRSETPPWWWEPSMMAQMQRWSGFFPPTVDKLQKFSEMMLLDMAEVDLLGSWCKDERFFQDELCNAKKVLLEDLEPFFCSKPWTRTLQGKKVVVVHPFAETIETQFSKRKDLFESHLLPDFELRTVKAVQSLGGESNGFSDWFEALEWMKAEIGKSAFDVCILGCGAYGFPLAAHVKRQGGKAIHLGGVTQLLFGIKGKRWEESNGYPYRNLYNQYWVRPGEQEKPKVFDSVEGGCYW